MPASSRLLTPVVLCLGALATAWAGEGTTAPPVPAAPAVTEAPKVLYAKPGPWGRIRYYYVHLEAPETALTAFPLPSARTRWSLPETDDARLTAFLTKAGVSADTTAALLAPARVMRMDGFVHLFPTTAEVMGLTPDARTALYTALAKHQSQNEFHAVPFVIGDETPAEWMRRSPLREPIRQAFIALSWKRNKTYFFSDVSCLLAMAESDAEARAIFKACTRRRSIIAQVEIDSSTDIPSLVSYWTGGFIRRDAQPLLESVQEAAQGDVLRLDLLHFLPPLPRRYGNTYPGLTSATNGRLPDCHWTSLNFFSTQTNDYYLDTKLAADAVLKNYRPVAEPYHYGDVLMFLDKQGLALHSCVHLADDLVYTKNGGAATTPWVINRLDQVKAIYDSEGSLRVQGYRLK